LKDETVPSFLFGENMDDCIIRFDHFSFQYIAQAEPTLHDICLTIRKGEKVLIAGPSGCGKSSLAHCINGLIPFSYHGEMQGSVTVCGKETRELGLFEISRHVGTVLQDSDEFLQKEVIAKSANHLGWGDADVLRRNAERALRNRAARAD
jgi:energy-coupling factor transporter ATP-binding protein EcfA2